MFRRNASLYHLALAVLCLIPTGCGSPVKQGGNSDAKQQEVKMNTEMNERGESVFACNAAALDDKQRQRYAALFKQLGEARQEVRELSDGYAFRFNTDAPTIQAVAEWVTYERLCCPFFDFTLEVEREGGPLWLRLTGREGVKEFIRSEMRVQGRQ